MSKRPARDPKAEALRARGTLNPHADRVGDELFRDSPFFDPRDLVLVKYEMVRRVQTDRQSVAQSARAFGFSRPSFYQAQAALARGGLAALIPQRRGPRRPHKLTQEVFDFVVELKTSDPAISTVDVVKAIKARFDLGVHRRTVERALAGKKKAR